LVLRGSHRSPRSISLRGNTTIKQVQKTIFDLIPDGTVVEEFTWQGPITKAPPVARQYQAPIIQAFLSELAARFPNVRITELPRCRGLWKREEWPSVEWIQEAGEGGPESQEEDEEEVWEGVEMDEDEWEEWIEDQHVEPDQGVFEKDLSPLGINHRCYP
ncbi:hypothetical protein FRC01_007199, partial [Tulasnella sp. 417]